ncbi:MAG: polyphenol oxidase family protein [Spirochaetaceae bacterium]|nr:polyphenol oxidase family protein [Spirochaetaceae bacterium]
MSLASAGSLRYNSGKENPARRKFLAEVLPDGTVPVPVYLIHSKRVYVAEPDASFPDGVCLIVNESSARVPAGSEGDGVITSCRSFAPVVTAADCMPVFLWDSRTGAFGICHSGWKGTGIAAEAVSLMGKTFSAKPEDICVILGPHIHECCYTVDAERAAYFNREFSPDCCVSVGGGDSCVSGSSFAIGAGGGGDPNASDSSNVSATKYRLSLARANIVSLTKAGIKPENILHCTDCTSCFSLPATFSADKATAANDDSADTADARGSATNASHSSRFFPYGSFRRQTAHLPEGTPLEERFKVFSAMAAVIGYGCAQQNKQKK